MGYYETYCQLCGVSFAIARFRRADEPLSAAWGYTGSNDTGDCGTVFFDETCGNTTGSGCELLEFEASRYQHIAGPGCASDSGYSGYRISLEEMAGCRAVQALVKKGEGWEPEDDDEDFEIESEFFLTGIGDGSPDVVPLGNIEPARHGIDSINIANVDEVKEGLPFHPTCFEVFRKVSMLHLGDTDVKGLWEWRQRNCSFEAPVSSIPRDFAVSFANEQWWRHEPGCEYLAANPVDIPGLKTLLKRVGVRFAPKAVFEPKGKRPEKSKNQENASADPFTTLSTEVTSMVVEYLPSKDIANLRLATRAVQQLPNILFRRLLLEDMPWMWELEAMPVGTFDWHRLYCIVKFGWIGLKGLKNRKRIWKEVEEIVRRIGKYRGLKH